jgi:hypothetical protein
MRRGTPGVVRKCLEISHSINANDCLISRQCAPQEYPLEWAILDVRYNGHRLLRYLIVITERDSGAKPPNSEGTDGRGRKGRPFANASARSHFVCWLRSLTLKLPAPDVEP